MNLRYLIGLLAIGFIFIPRADGAMVINEFLADPPGGLSGDANNDGIRNASDDEFIELFNWQNSPVDLSGWSLWDAEAQRHTFPAETFLPEYGILVVFGGGSPVGFAVSVFTASSGRLSLNNTSDEVILKNSAGQIVDRWLYGAEANADQSLTRFLDGEGSFIPHLTVPNHSNLASPGRIFRTVPGGSFSVAPEPNIFFGWGLIFLGGLKLLKLYRKSLFRSNHHPSFGP